MWQSIKNIYHLFQGVAAVTLSGFPGRGMTIIGVTGTDGKTTTASIIYHILKTAGYKTALVSSVSAIIDGKNYDTGFHVTTPNSFAVQSYLKKAKKAGVKFVVLEVTSHALDQHRVYGVPFKIGVLTNISNEHLDYHKTYERYAKTKAKLLKSAHVAIINKEDRSYKFIKSLLKHHKVISYGFKKDADLNLHNFQFRTKVFGQFNQYNILAAIAVARELRLSDEVIRKAVASYMTPEGREEIVYNKDFAVIIDFAHTPNSFLHILPEARKFTKNRLIHVFGAAGKRDAFKRPQMGKLSSDFADIVVVTAEDPRNELVEKINDEIVKGITNKKFEIVSESKIKEKGKFVVKIPDRREAIQFAISNAKKGDVVLLTGKGHEKSMNYGKGEELWSEHEVVKEALKERNLG